MRSLRPLRLVAQDVALSRPKQGFESPRGHPKETRAFEVRVSSIEGMSLLLWLRAGP